MLLTRDPDIASEAERAGVDRLFVDLEILGKAERQAGRPSVISGHSVADARAVRRVLHRSELLVRINPMHEGSEREIEDVIEAGADVIMLPMFISREEVESFVQRVGGRRRTCLLLETAPAMVRLNEILTVPGIDEVHVGLNDLHLSMGLTFMYELLAGGILDDIAHRVLSLTPHVVFGFGGGARIRDQHPVAPSDVLREHVRLGSRMIILSQSFTRTADSLADLRSQIDLAQEVNLVREVIQQAVARTPSEVEEDRERIHKRIWEVNAFMRNGTVAHR